ncbi:MAG: hypothetical protein AAF750_17195, partial [Planctomycetota bacterium]
MQPNALTRPTTGVRLAWTALLAMLLVATPVLAEPEAVPAYPGSLTWTSDVNFDENKLSNILRFLEIEARVAIEVDEAALDAIGANLEDPITLKAADIARERLIALVVSQLGNGRGR